MTTNEIIALCLSGAAFLVSFTTLYFTIFHKKLALIGCLTAYKTESDNNKLLGDYEFSLSNTGNKELLVREIQVDLIGASGNYIVPEIYSTEIPAVLKPGQIFLLNICLPSLFMRNATKSGHKVSIQFHVLSPKAKLYIVSKELEFLNEELEINSEGWKPFRLRKPFKPEKPES
ncbi:hypothetical protein ACFL36_01195 [Thermodesulfobacteriota bacterium]